MANLALIRLADLLSYGFLDAKPPGVNIFKSGLASKPGAKKTHWPESLIEAMANQRFSDYIS